MEIDEAGRHHQTGGIDHPVALQGSGRHHRDPAVLDPDVTDRIEVGFGVDDAAAVNHDLITIIAAGTGRQQHQARQDASALHAKLLGLSGKERDGRRTMHGASRFRNRVL